MFAATRILTVGAVVLSLSGLMAGSALADPLPADVETTEVMMNSLGTEVQGVARMLGLDEAVSLDFTTKHDPVGKTFGFALEPGTTYMGQSLSLVGQGSYNPALSCWQGEATVRSGRATSWYATWTSQVQSDDPYVGYVDWAIQGSSRWPWPDTHGQWIVVEDPPGSGKYRSFWEGILTLGGVEVGRFRVPDENFTSNQSWNWNGEFTPYSGFGPAFGVSSSGTYTPGGGPGKATFKIVPEPAALVLVALGGLGFLWKRRS